MAPVNGFWVDSLWISSNIILQNVPHLLGPLGLNAHQRVGVLMAKEPAPSLRLVGSSSGVAQFGTFRVNLETGELWQKGQKVALPQQSFQVLEALLGRPGKLVSREELRRRLWPDGNFVDFENGLNTAVKRLRTGLGDSAEQPRFIETLPRRGYRFVGPVEWTVPEPEPEPHTPTRSKGRSQVWAWAKGRAAVLGCRGWDPLSIGSPRQLAENPFAITQGCADHPIDR
jgi:DNA-binding winged helix-turn-helix (wHTH) protein